MNKLIIGSFLAIGLLLGCKKKEKEPLEYFSFTANGVDYNYPQEKRSGFLGVNQALWAGSSSGNLGYFIGASNFEDLAIPGTFRFTFFPGDQIPQQDTIILDGVSAKVNLIGFLKDGDNYQHYGSLPGKIIFTERSEDMLSGTFEFQAELYRPHPDYVSHVIWTDTFIHITNGKFSIKPTLQNE
ncbi:MAG TPA: hypothetical protein VFD78_04115 [Chitinophagaceae bacterium]|nr:hypothetical protein [Chitinophagaceae bacterium]